MIKPFSIAVAVFRGTHYLRTGEPGRQRPVEPGESCNEAVEAMKLRANALNIKLVEELPLSKQVEATSGKPQWRME